MENSRFKFRAWHDEHQEMVHFDNKKASNDMYIAYNILKLMADNSPFLMQYTGLKDKNCVEIYEGDIVAYDLGIDNEKPENYKIVFDNKQCAYFMFPLNDKSRLRKFTYSAKNDCVVIGNIYENLELLKDN